MGVLDRIRRIFNPQEETPEQFRLKMVEIKKNLMNVEDRLATVIRKERNVINNVESKSAKKAAEDRLRNAYVSLRMVAIAQERLYDISSTYELTGAMRDLNRSVAVLNRIEKKSDKEILFLNRNVRKILERKKASADGGMKQYYDMSLEKIIMGEDVFDKLSETDIPLKSILKEDKETMDNLDDLMAGLGDDDLLEQLNLSGVDDMELDDLVSKVG